MTLRNKRMIDRNIGTRVMRDATLAAGFVRALFEFAVAKGADRHALARSAGFDPSGVSDPDARIAFPVYVALMRAAKELTGDGALALRFGEEVELAQVSLLGHVALPAPTLAEAFSQLNHYSRLVLDFPGAAERFRLECSGDQAWLVDHRPDPNAFPELTESTFSRIVSAMRRFLGGADFAKGVHVTHPPPPQRDEYDRVFQVATVFRSDRNALLTDAAWLSQPPPPRSGYAGEVLGAHAERLLGKLDSSRSMTARLEAALIGLLPAGRTTAEVIASRLGVSRQTLFRKLKAEETTYENVLDRLRHRLALEYLHDRTMSVSETAYRLGFSDPAAFSRAFKRWTGSNPRDARRRDG